MHARLLGGWLDVADEVRRLEQALMALPDTCACGHGSAHLSGACPCCLDSERTLDRGCTDCETLLASLGGKVNALVEAALRYLPALDVVVAANLRGSDPPRLPDLRRQILRVAVTFQRLQTAAGEFRRGCTTSHLRLLKKLARELGAAAREVDEMLDPVSMPHG